jgi:hypothetical protein
VSFRIPATCSTLSRLGACAAGMGGIMPGVLGGRVAFGG